jgi:nitrous oxidase accessory protein NosD
MTRRIVLLAVPWLFVAFPFAYGAADDVRLDHAGMMIKASADIKPGVYRLTDAGDKGALHIDGDGITVDFHGAELVGGTDDQLPDAYTGKGIIIRGKNVVLRNAKVRGYRVGIYAHECPGLVIEDVDVSGNYQKHLLSTPEAEDGSDWLFGHENDKKEWMRNYGAALYVDESDGVTLRRIRARHGQNGICIDRVNDSKIYDNDCSFLSGWGLAMWRSNRNVITRNAFDFCIRGYSHGVYNRGQDSAGIFMFEQNSNNVIAENSVTHGGDGFFGFAGLEALGDKPPSTPNFNYKRCGNNDNLLIKNDFSYAAAHGIEMTFSFGNKFLDNRIVGNAICGVWGGYSQDTLIAGNDFEDNGEMGYGLERGGVNIEHGSNNTIEDNTFKNNKCGVRLWCAPNPAFQQKPWGKANHESLAPSTIAWNTFEGGAVGLHLQNAIEVTLIDNKMAGVGRAMVADKDVKITHRAWCENPLSHPTTRESLPAKSRAMGIAESGCRERALDTGEKEKWQLPKYPVYGETHPVGARKPLAGRQNIIMTEWGPYDFTDFALCPRKVSGGENAMFRVLGPSGEFKVTKVDGDVKVSPMGGELPATVTVTAPKSGLHPFTVAIKAGGKDLTAEGTLLRADWTVKFYQWDAKDDPREHQDKWDALIAGAPLDEQKLSAIDFKWGGGAPSGKVKPDHFGTVATASIDLPAGRYRIWTVSDDGIRVWVDNRRVIDDWTWHPPKENSTTVELKAGSHKVRIEHFEIDGLAQLQFRIEPAR